MRLILCLMTACVLGAQPENRSLNHRGGRADRLRPREPAMLAIAESHEMEEEEEDTTNQAPSSTTSTTTEDVGVACDADHLFREGYCICDEDPCFHHESMLHIKHGRQTPFYMTKVMTALRQFLSVSPERSPFAVHFNPSLLDQLRGRVVELATAVRPLYDLLNPSQAQLTAELVEAPEMQSDHGDGDEANDNRFDQLRHEGLRKQIQDFLGRTLRQDSDYGSLRNEVRSITHNLVTVSTSLSIGIPILYLQALAIIDKALLGIRTSTFESRGWEADIRKLGVDIDPILPCFAPVEFDDDESIDPLNDMYDLASRVILVQESIDEEFYQAPLPSDKRQLQRFMRELESVSESDDPESVAFAQDLRDAFCPNARAFLGFVNWMPMPNARTKGKLIADFIEFCDFSTQEKVRLTQQFFFTFIPMFVKAIVDPVGSPPLQLRLPVRNACLYQRQSMKFLEDASEAYRYPCGIEVIYFDTRGEGDGIRRDWFARMVKHYFRVYDPEHPSRANNPRASTHKFLWEYSDSTQAAIRPRGYAVAKNHGEREKMQRRFQACGRLIGMGIRYGIIPGISLSASTLAHLHRPSDDFDALALAAREDEIFAQNLDKLRLTDWENSDAVESAIGHLQVNIAGEKVGITRENVDEYIRQEKFHRVVWSINREMQAVRRGISDFIRPGTLNLFSEDEIGRLIRGVVEVTPAMIIGGIAFRVATQQNDWLIEILSGMTEDELKAFHKFVTGTSEPPIRAGEPGFTWMKYQSDSALPLANLPTSRTCFGAITSPAYSAKVDFETKLNQAIAEAGTIELK